MLAADHSTPSEWCIEHTQKTIKLLVYDYIACIFVIGFSHTYFFPPSLFEFRSDSLMFEQSNAINQLEPHAVQVK